MNLDRKKIVENFIEVFLRMQKCIGANRDIFFRKYGLNRAQVELLYNLHYSNELQVKELANNLNVTDGAITQLVKGLIDLGYLEKLQDKEDKRIVKITFTLSGRKKFDRFRQNHIRKIEGFLSKLDNEEIKVLNKLFSQIILCQTNKN